MRKGREEGKGGAELRGTYLIVQIDQYSGK